MTGLGSGDDREMASSRANLELHNLDPERLGPPTRKLTWYNRLLSEVSKVQNRLASKLTVGRARFVTETLSMENPGQ